MISDQLAVIGTNQEIVKPSGDLIAFARSPEELQQNLAGLTAWALGKLTEAREHHHHMTENLNQAKIFGWGVKGFQAAVRLARKRSSARQGVTRLPPLWGAARFYRFRRPFGFP